MEKNVCNLANYVFEWLMASQPEMAVRCQRDKFR